MISTINDKIGIIGGGRMGSRIAKSLGEVYEVILYDSNPDNISKDILASVSVEIKNSLEDLKDCKLIIEAISENLEAKLNLFAEIEELVSKDTIIATNTSSLSINELGSQLLYKERFLGLHFMNPADKNELVEVIKSRHTSDEVVEDSIQVLSVIQKTGIVVEDRPGFVLNRLLLPMINDAINMLNDNVASAQDIDKIMMIGAKHPIGPLALADLIGLDVVLAILNNLYNRLRSDRFKASELLKQYVSQGKLGKKTKIGIYDYSKF